MPKKDYIRREITNIGRTQDTEEGDACPVCIESDDYLGHVTKYDNRTTYKKIDVDSEEGEELADEKNIKSIPYIEDCKTYKEGDKERTRCRTIEGFDEGDWSDLTKLKEQSEEEAQAKKEEENKANIEAEAEKSEAEIKEPEEPKVSEPESV